MSIPLTQDQLKYTSVDLQLTMNFAFPASECNIQLVPSRV